MAIINYRAIITVTDLVDSDTFNDTIESDTYEKVAKAIFNTADSLAYRVDHVVLSYVMYNGKEIELINGSFDEFWDFDQDPIASMAYAKQALTSKLDTLKDVSRRKLEHYNELDELEVSPFFKGVVAEIKDVLSLIEYQSKR